MAKVKQKREGKVAKVPADDIARAKTFYGGLFGWTFAKIPTVIQDY